MAKLTVFFKDQPIQTAECGSVVIHIGRDESNELSIDSLALAPAHAAIIQRGSEQLIKQLNPDFPLIINGKKQNKYHLKNGDIINIGKYHILYEPLDSSAQEPFTATKKTVSNKPHHLSHSDVPNASLEIKGGKHLDRQVPLTSNMTRIGRKGSGIIIITFKKQGYFASVLEPGNQLKVNNEELTDKSVQLKHNDILLINNTPMHFIWTEEE